MIDAAGEEIEVPAVEPVGDAVKAERPGAGIGEDFPVRAGRGVAGFDGLEIIDQA